jgi:large subunit ribosomal protein L9
MKVILLEDVKGHGKKGQLIEAADGFARNYLLPRKLAQPATAANLGVLKAREEAKKHREDTERAEALASAEKLKNCTVKVLSKAGEKGRLFGAVTNKEIAEALQAQYGIEIDKRKIVLNDPIKNFGTYEVKVKIHPEVSQSLKIIVTEAQ